MKHLIVANTIHLQKSHTMGLKLQSQEHFREGIYLIGFRDFPLMRNTLLEQLKSRSEILKAWPIVPTVGDTWLSDIKSQIKKRIALI